MTLSCLAVENPPAFMTACEISLTSALFANDVTIATPIDHFQSLSIEEHIRAISGALFSYADLAVRNLVPDRATRQVLIAGSLAAQVTRAVPILFYLSRRRSS